MMEIQEDLAKYVEEEIIPLYDSFDKGHRRDHVSHVIDESLRLATCYKADRSMAYVIAAYHDTGLVDGRETHHLSSGRIIREDKRLRTWFSPEQIETMAQAAEDHRASSSHEPRSIYGCIVAEADRQIDVETIIRRTVQYGLAHYEELDREGQISRAISHLNEKYGENGYLKLYLEASENAKNLKRLRQIIKNGTLIRKMVEDCLDNEQKDNEIRQ